MSYQPEAQARDVSHVPRLRFELVFPRLRFGLVTQAMAF